MHEFRRRAVLQGTKTEAAPVFVEIQIPVLKQLFLDSLSADPLAVIGLDVELPSSVEVRKMTLDGLEVLTAVRENLNHDFWCTPNGPRNQVDVRRR